MVEFDAKKDYLEVDTPIPGQGYVCLSFVSPESMITGRDRFRFERFLAHKEVSVDEYDAFVSNNEAALEKEYSVANNFQTTTRGLKVRGVYETVDEARARAEQVRAGDPNFHVYVAPVGYWLPWDPSPDAVQDSEYLDKNLNELMYNYNKNRQSSADHFAQEAEERKRITREEGQAGARASSEQAVTDESTG